MELKEAAVSGMAGQQSASGTEPSNPGRQVPGILVWVLILVLSQHAYRETQVPAAHKAMGSLPVGLLFVLGVCCVASLVWVYRSRRQFLTNLASVPFSSAILGVLALATAIGTFIPQEELQPLEHGSRLSFGASLSGLLFLNELFQSFWFGGLLALLALSLLLAVAQKPFTRPWYWGFTLAHLGMVVVMLGATIGRYYGVSGMLKFHVGEEAKTFSVQRQGPAADKSAELAFSLKLDSFEVENHPRKDPVRFAVYPNTGEGKEQCPKPVLTAKLEEVRKGIDVPMLGQRLRVKEFYPDAVVSNTMEETAEKDFPSAVQVRTLEKDRDEKHWVVAGSPAHTCEALAGLELEWGSLSDTNWLGRTKESRSAASRIVLPDGTEIEPRVGETYPVPGTKSRFKVAAFYPDFSYDIEKKQAFSVSEEPNNPALGLEIYEDTAAPKVNKMQYLFPGASGHMGKDGPLGLIYRFTPPVKHADHIVRLDAKARQWAYATAGKEVLRKSFELGKPQELTFESGVPSAHRVIDLEVLKVLEHARPKSEVKALSDKLGRPAALVELFRNGPSEPPVEIVLGERAELSEDFVLLLELKAEEVKAYRSHVSVLRNGKVERQVVVAVNDPLTVDAFTFYQSDYNPEDLTYSGLKVVKDPGLGLVYLGMVMVALGAAYTLYVRPRLQRPVTPAEGLA